MLWIKNLTKSFQTNEGRNTVIDNLTLTLGAGRSLALLGRNGAGKSTLMQLIAGNLRPDSGEIRASGTISWPIGFGGALHPNLTGSQNTKFISRVYGVDSDELNAFVQDFAALGDHFFMPMRTYSSGMRARLTFGISMGIAFDIYLVDEVTAAGDGIFRQRSKAVFKDRMKTASAIMVNHNLGEIKEFCDSGIVLEHGKLQFFDNVDDAIQCHKEHMKMHANPN